MIDDEADKKGRMAVWRRRQVLSVAAGMLAFTVSLWGGSWKIAWLAQLGLGVFLLCVLCILVFGFAAYRHRLKGDDP